MSTTKRNFLSLKDGYQQMCNKFLIFLLILSFIEIAPCIGQDHPKHPVLSFWTVGGKEGIIKRFGANFTQTFNLLKKNKYDLDRILLALAKQPLTEKQILEKCAISKIQFKFFISNLNSIQLIQYDKDRWATSIPVITDQEMKAIKEDLSPLASKVAQYIQSKLPPIKTLYEKVKTPSDPSWKNVAHLVIDKFLVDGTFHRAIGILESDKHILELYDQSQRDLPAFFLEQGANYSIFGTNWYPFPRENGQREIYVLHGAIMDRFNIPLNRHKEDLILSSALFKISPEGRIDSLTNPEKDILKELHWIDGDRLLVPVVNADTVKSLFPAIDRIGKDAAEVVFKNYTIIINSFNESPYSRFLNAGGDYIQVCYHILFSILLEKLVDADVLPPIPKPVPDHFGVFIIFGRVF